jgi:hypothetical protein
MLGDNTSGWTVMLLPMTCLLAGVWISTGFRCVQLTIIILSSYVRWSDSEITLIELAG